MSFAEAASCQKLAHNLQHMPDLSVCVQTMRLFQMFKNGRN